MRSPRHHLTSQKRKLSRIGHSTSQHLPLWIFSWSGIQQSLHHQTPQYCCSIGSMGTCRAVRSCVRGEAIFRTNSFTEYKRSGLSKARKVNLAATLWKSFNSSPVRRSSSSLTSSGGSCHFAVLCSSLVRLALGPPTSSVPGVATPLASVNPKALKARETCCWSGSYSILHCRNVSVLARKLAVRDCDDPGPRVTTLLSSYAPRSKLSAYSRSSCRPTTKKSSPCTRRYVSKSLWKKCHGDATLQNLSVMLSPPLGWVPRSLHRLSQFPAHAWLLCLGVFVWQSDADVADHTGVKVGSTHICDGDQEKVLHSKNVFLARNTDHDSQSFQRRCCRDDPFMAHTRTHRRERYRGASAFPLFVSST